MNDSFHRILEGRYLHIPEHETKTLLRQNHTIEKREAASCFLGKASQSASIDCTQVVSHPLNSRSILQRARLQCFSSESRCKILPLELASFQNPHPELAERVEPGLRLAHFPRSGFSRSSPRLSDPLEPIVHKRPRSNHGPIGEIANLALQKFVPPQLSATLNNL